MLYTPSRFGGVRVVVGLLGRIAEERDAPTWASLIRRSYHRSCGTRDRPGDRTQRSHGIRD